MFICHEQQLTNEGVPVIFDIAKKVNFFHFSINYSPMQQQEYSAACIFKLMTRNIGFNLSSCNIVKRDVKKIF